MKGKTLLSLAIVLSVTLTLLPVLTVSAVTPTLKIEPALVEDVPVGNDFTVTLKIQDVTNLWSWMCVISWDPAVLSCVSVVEGPFLKSIGATFWLAAPPNASAIPSLSCTSMAVPKAGASGTGTLATITFNATEIGDSYVRLTGDYLLNSSSTSGHSVFIEHTVVDGAVTVVPEFPTSIILPLFLMATAGIAVLVKMFAKKSRYCIKVP